MARETPVFISYARADERYATELMQPPRPGTGHRPLAGPDQHVAG